MGEFLELNLDLEVANLKAMSKNYANEEYIGEILRVFTKIETSTDEKKYNLKRGYYCSLTSENAREDKEKIKNILSREIQAALDDCKVTSGVILVVGLGNSSVTTDALGKAVLDRISLSNNGINRHSTAKGVATVNKNPDSSIFNNSIQATTTDIARQGEDLNSSKRNPDGSSAFTLAKLLPSVSFLTNIDSFDIISGVVEKIKPSAIFVVDSLATKKLSRIGKCVQISTAGITAGSGVGNPQKTLSAKNLGVKIISFGVPMVSNPTDEAKEYDMLLISKEAGSLITLWAEIIADAINFAF